MLKWVIPTPDRLKKVNAFSLLIILIFGAWYTMSHQVRRWSVNPKDWSDYSMNLNNSLDVINNLVYPPLSNGFFYPPPNLIIRVGLGELGLTASGILWTILLIISLFAVFESALYLLGLSNHPAKYLHALLALLLVEYWVEFDLRAINGNLLYLASLLLALVCSNKSKSFTGGFFLAFSIVLKLYSVVFLPYLLFKRQYRLCLASALWLGVFFVVLPIAYFGIDDAVALTMNWAQLVLNSRGNMDFPWEVKSYLISLHKTLLIVLTERGGHGQDNVMNLTESSVLFITQAAQFLWLMLVAFYFWVSRRELPRDQAGVGLIMDAGALTMLMLPLSPVLQPHHGVILLIPAIVLAAVALDSNQLSSLRRTILAIALTCGLATQFGPAGSFRGFGMMISVVLFLCALILIRKSNYRFLSRSLAGVFLRRGPASP